MNSIRDALLKNENGQQLVMQADMVEHDIQLRWDVIRDLVYRVFRDQPRYNRRTIQETCRAYNVAEEAARLGGEEYQEAIRLLRFAYTSPQDYADACLAFKL